MKKTPATEDRVVYHQQYSFCGKSYCRVCREGSGHGPYWYAYQTVNGRTKRKYVGKNLPAYVQAEEKGGQGLQAPVEGPAVPLVRVYTFGQFRIDRRPRYEAEWQTATEATWQHQRVRVLLATLICSMGRMIGREQLMDILAPDLDIEKAGARLDRTVYTLRQLFEPERGTERTQGAEALLQTKPEVVQLADQSQIWVDADAFEAFLAQAHRTSDAGERERLLDEAMKLYGGDFLPPARQDFISARREALKRSWTGATLELADLRIKRHDLQAALDPLDKLLAVDPLNEAAVQRMMKLLVHLGRRGEALRSYKRLAQILQKEHRMTPLPDTRRLYEALTSESDGKSINAAFNLTTSPSGPSPNKQVDDPETQGSPRPENIIPIGRNHQLPLIGRTDELKFLRQISAAAEQIAAFQFHIPSTAANTEFSVSQFAGLPQERLTQRHCAILLGDIGIGKTRLLEEISMELKKKGWIVSWTREYPEATTPYRLWVELLRLIFAQAPAQRQEFARHAQRFQPLVTLLPELSEILPAFGMVDLHAEQDQLRLWQAIYEFLALMSQAAPLLIAIDDLHWADESSAQLFAYLVRRVHNLPIVLFATCREHEQSQALKSLLPSLQRERAIDLLSIAPLTPQEITTLVATASGQHFSEEAVQEISVRASGNPFFAEEMTRALALHAAPSLLGTTSFVYREQLTAALPQTITAVLDLRLNQLTPSCLRLLQKASVLGGSFDFRILSQMDIEDEMQVLDLLEEALEAGMLTEQGEGSRILYHFWHPLLVSHLYEKLSAARRAHYHRKAAVVLQHLHGDQDEHAAAITHHLVQGGGDTAQIIHFADLAAHYAYSLSAFPDAEKYFKIAFEHLPQQPSEIHLYYLESLGELTRCQAKHVEAREYFTQAIDEHVQLYGEDLSQLPREAEIRAICWMQLGVTWYNYEYVNYADEFYEHAEQILRQATIERGPAWAALHLERSYMYWRQGNMPQATDNVKTALRLFEEVLAQPKEHPHRRPRKQLYLQRILEGEPGAPGRAYAVLGLIAGTGGKPAEGLVYLKKALIYYEQHEMVRDIGIITCNIGDIYLRMHQLEDARAYIRRSLRLVERVNEISLRYFCHGNLGLIALRQGNLREAEQEFRQALAGVELGIDAGGLLTIFYCHKLPLTLYQGRIDDARVGVYHALKTSRKINVDPYLGMCFLASATLRAEQAKYYERDEQQRARLLSKATRTLRRALALPGIEQETRAQLLLMLGEVLVLRGMEECLPPILDQVANEIEDNGIYWLQGYLSRLSAMWHCAQREHVEARQYYERALQTFEKQGMVLEKGRVLLELGTLLLNDQVALISQRSAITSLQEALSIFERCEAEGYQKHVQAIMARAKEEERQQQTFTA